MEKGNGRVHRPPRTALQRRPQGGAGGAGALIYKRSTRQTAGHVRAPHVRWGRGGALVTRLP